jgi:isocitrate/isopropylmalate dehydrogenase
LPLLLPAIDLLEAEGHGEAARRTLTAVESVLSAGRALTPDLGGRATTTDMTEAIVAALA